MESWARRSLAALTIFMAFVICWEFWIDLIRLRTSFSCPAIVGKEVFVCTGMGCHPKCPIPGARLMMGLRPGRALRLGAGNLPTKMGAKIAQTAEKSR